MKKSFRKNEWALCFTDHDASVSLVRVAEQSFRDDETVLVYMGNFTTRCDIEHLHKVPASMKMLLPKDRPGKLTTTMGI